MIINIYTYKPKPLKWCDWFLYIYHRNTRFTLLFDAADVVDVLLFDASDVEAVLLFDATDVEAVLLFDEADVEAVLLLDVADVDAALLDFLSLVIKESSVFAVFLDLPLLFGFSGLTITSGLWSD